MRRPFVKLRGFARSTTVNPCCAACGVSVASPIPQGAANRASVEITVTSGNKTAAVRVKLCLMKTIPVMLAALILGAPAAFAQEAAPLLINSVPQRAKSAEAFAPRGWKTEKVVRGDLNRDGRADAAIVLVEAKSARVEDGVPMGRRRALVIALRQRRGWQRVGFSNQLLLGTRDGGAFYGASDASVDLAIEKGVVLVNMEFGSREVTNTTHILRWEPKRRAVYVIGMDTATRDRATGGGETMSVNYLTGARKNTVYKTGTDKGKTASRKGARRWLWLGAVRADDRYAQ